MSHPNSHLERQALRAEEQAQRQRAEEAAVIVGMMETTSLEEARGAAFLHPEPKRGEKRRKPIRRLSGLEWLHRKGKITDQELAAGEVYGGLYRAAHAAPSIRSNLNQSPGGGSDSASTIGRQIKAANRRLKAGERLTLLHARLGYNADLITALDAVAGREQTPREASPDGREAAILGALAKAALGMLATMDGDWPWADPKRCAELLAEIHKANGANAEQNKRLRMRAYYENNRELFYANNAKRRAALRDQVAPDADPAAIAMIFKMAERLTRLTAATYHVDHITPISKGGLHHQNNLVVMRGDWNKSKYTQSWPWLSWFNSQPSSY